MNYKEEIKSLVDTVIQEGASDLHISVGRRPTIRVTGSLLPLIKKEILSEEDAKGIILELIGEEHRDSFEKKKDIDFSFSSGDGVRFRGNAFYQQGFPGAALRVVSSVIKTFEELNLPPILSTFSRKKQGFFLVVGPVGQGKTTTLAAMIDSINKERAEHILTIEDPIEYLFKGDKSIIDQREVKLDTESFSSALRAMFRQDINVAMVGEMRGTETMSAAVTAAETGHLIFSTLHTNSASQTIDRIIDSFTAEQQSQIRLQLAGSLLGIFSQRLVPRIAGGLIPAYELLIKNNAVGNLIREGRTHEIDVVIETGTESGMVSLDHSLADLVRREEIAANVAMEYSLNPRVLERLI